MEFPLILADLHRWSFYGRFPSMTDLTKQAAVLCLSLMQERTPHYSKHLPPQEPHLLLHLWWVLEAITSAVLRNWYNPSQPQTASTNVVLFNVCQGDSMFETITDDEVYQSNCSSGMDEGKSTNVVQYYTWLVFIVSRGHKLAVMAQSPAGFPSR